MRRVCTDANVAHPQRMTATKMRHRISTLYAAMDIPSQDGELFCKHMGHSLQVNENVYQVPLAVAEINSVGSRLAQLDGDMRPCSVEASCVGGRASISGRSDCTARADDTGQSVSNNVLRQQADDDEPPHKLLHSESTGITVIIYKSN